MNDLASRLMLQGQEAQTALPTAIFGTAGTVRHALASGSPSIRVGFWPIQSDDAPQAAMGIACMLGYLLERHRDVRVYRVLAEVDGQPDEFLWSMEKSQFDVDDWQLDDLDDNVGVWGTLSQWNLELSIENDLAVDDDEEVTLSYSAQDLPDLVSMLPQVAADIATHLDVTDLKIVAPSYVVESWDSNRLQSMLTNIFQWELRLYLALWGQTWSGAEMLADAEKLIDQARDLGDLGAWLVSSAVVRVLTMIDTAIDSELMEIIDALIENYPDNPTPGVLLANILYERGLPRQAYEMLEARIEEGEGDALDYLALAELYQRGGRIPEAVDTFQRAIEYDLADVAIYRRYAAMLIAMDYSGLPIGSYVLVDPDDIGDDLLLWEAVESLEAALKIEPDSPELLSALTMQLIDLGDSARLWATFRKLLNADVSGDYTHVVIDGLQSVEDVHPAIDIVSGCLTNNPRRVDLYLDLAALYMVIDDSASAQDNLTKARKLTEDEDTIADIERLTLLAEDPDFEMRLGEITDSIGAGAEIEAEEVEYLEHALEKVPTYAELYVLIAKAYLAWGEASTALETLLDGHENLPDDPDIVSLLCQTLWDSGEDDLAFTYLDKGIAANPVHVPLLALAGQYLFEDGQQEAARAYLLRAETLSPRDPVLIQVRQHIGRTLNQ